MTVGKNIIKINKTMPKITVKNLDKTHWLNKVISKLKKFYANNCTTTENHQLNR